MRGRAQTPFAAVALAAWLLSSHAAADPTGPDKAMAEVLFRAGRQLITAGKVGEACDRFAESQRLDPKLGTLLNLALCHEQLNKTASAWGEFTDAAGQAKIAGQADREKFARSHAAALEPVLSRLVLTGAGTAGLRLTIDGLAIGLSAIGAPLPIDPGEHTVVAEAPGKNRWEAKIQVPPGPASTTLQIPSLEDALPDTPPPPPQPPAPVTTTLPPPPIVEKGPNGGRIAGIVIGSLGLAGLALGGVFGGLAFAREAEARKVCPNTACLTQTGLDLHDAAAGFATASTAAFIAGGVAAATGVVLFVASRDKPSRRSAFIAPGLGGVVIGGSF